jgi:exopolysaccharide production protein ExoQ
MNPHLALFLWVVLLLALLRYDPAKDRKTSVALWVPLIWIFITATRLPSQWLGGSVGSAAQAFEEGNPIDRAIFTSLIVLCFVILVSRAFNWGAFVSRNKSLIVLLLFALISVVWSDFAFVAFKRWFRDLGNYLVILVVLSDPHPLEAASTVLRRLGYLLVPLSIMLIKYFPEIGMQYSFWTGAPMYVGPTTGKNMLGVLCLASGIFFFWDAVTRWTNRKDRQTRRILMMDVAFIGMTIWLLKIASSATSSVCLMIGCLIIVIANSKASQRYPSLVKLVVPASFFIYLILAFGFDINGEMAGAVGRDPTMTGRSDIWRAVLSTHTNPILGTGYESFWLGPRLSHVWQMAGQVNEAHNGYLEIYLNLGLIGDALLLVFMIASFRSICKKLSPSFRLASLALSLWTITLFYNMTEAAAFKGQYIWVVFVLVVIIVSNYEPTVQEEPIALSPDTSAVSFRGRSPVPVAGRFSPGLTHRRLDHR